MMRYEKEYVVNNKLAKDSIHKKLTGVCAGIARHYDLPRLAVRIAAIAALIMVPVATGVAYVVATLLLPEGRSR